MVKVAATFDWKAERSLPEEKAASLSFWRWVGVGTLAAGGYLIYRANHQYYHLTGTSTDILRTYNQTLWASRVVTGGGAFLFARNQFWLTDSNRKSWGAKPFFHSLEGKKYPEINAAVDADEWGFLNNGDIWALLKPSFEELGCSQFWKWDKGGAEAFKKQIKTLVKEAASGSDYLLSKDGFYAEHGELPFWKNWIPQEDAERFISEVEAFVQTEGPVKFIETYGGDRLAYVIDKDIRKEMQEAYVKERFLTEYKKVPKGLGFTKETWTELSNTQKLAGVKSWQNYAALRKHDGAKKACDLMLTEDLGRGFVLVWMQEVGYRIFKDSYEFTQLKEYLSLPNYFEEEAKMLPAGKFFEKHGWPKDAPTSKYTESVKQQIACTGLDRFEIDFYKLLPDEDLKKAVINYYVNNITTKSDATKITDAGVKLRNIFDARWENQGYTTIVQNERELFWWALKHEAYKPEEWKGLETELQQELKGCVAADLPKTYAIAIELGCINPEWKIVQNIALSYCVLSYQTNDEVSQFLLSNNLIPQKAKKAIEACAKGIEEAKKANGEKMLKQQKKSEDAEQAYTDLIDKRTKEAEEMDKEVKELTDQMRRLFPHASKSVSTESLRKLEEEIFDLKRVLREKDGKLIGVEDARSAELLKKKEKELKALYKSTSTEEEVETAREEGKNSGKIVILRQECYKKIRAADKHKTKTGKLTEDEIVKREAIKEKCKEKLQKLPSKLEKKITQLEKARKGAFGFALAAVANVGV